jgi:hypothetical protein
VSGDVTLIDPPGSLPSRSEVIDFVSTQPIVCISVEHEPGTDRSARETVYDGTDASNNNGSFSRPYRYSSRSGNDWHIVRENGWPVPFQLRIKQLPPASSASPRPALQPTIYSPLAQWALQGAPDTARMYLDRSGNNNHLTGGTATAVPDLISGQTAISNGKLTATIPALAVTGALTVTGRLKWTPNGQQQVIIDVGSSGVGCVYLLAASPSGNLLYYCEGSGGVPVTWTSALACTAGQWHWFELVRDAAGTGVGLTLDGTAQTSPTLTAPVAAPGNGLVTVGSNDSGVQPWIDALADLDVWGAAVSATDSIPLRNAALGL